jgi:hypothetical protein
LATSTQVSKYLTGKKQDFALKNSTTEFGDITDIFTVEGFSKIYLLDSGAGLFVFDKETGNYEGLYKSSRIGEAKGFVVNEAKKKVYLLSDNSLFVFDLK